MNSLLRKKLKFSLFIRKSPRTYTSILSLQKDVIRRNIMPWDSIRRRSSFMLRTAASISFLRTRVFLILTLTLNSVLYFCLFNIDFQLSAIFTRLNINLHGFEYLVLLLFFISNYSVNLISLLSILLISSFAVVCFIFQSFCFVVRRQQNANRSVKVV